MAQTRIKSQDVGDSQVQTIDLADTSVTFGKLSLATNPAIENDGSGNIRVKVDGFSVYRSADGIEASGIIIRAKNTTAGAFSAGTVVYFSGASSGVPTINKSEQDAPTKAMAHAICVETINGSNGEGRVLLTGIISGINTSGVTAGAVVYTSSIAGGFISTAPTTDLLQAIGRCLVSNASTGSLLFIPQPAVPAMFGATWHQGFVDAFNTSSIADPDGDGVEVVGFRAVTSHPGGTGSVYYHSTNKTHNCDDGLASRAFSGIITTKTTASATVASTASETFFNTDQRYTLPSNWFTPGRRLRVVAWGKYGLDALATIQLRLNLGAINLMDTGPQSPLTSASLNRNWRIEADVVCVSTGASGAMILSALATLPTGLALPNSVNSVALNTAGSALLVASVQFSAATATNQANMLGLIVEGN